jgi:LacI family transcriptional regulator
LTFGRSLRTVVSGYRQMCGDRLNDDLAPRRVTVHDVARAAGVSLATVDRVLNARPGVRAITAEKVEEAIARLGFSRDVNASLMARSRDLKVMFFIPSGSNEFMDSLVEAVSRRLGSALTDRMHLETQRIRPFDTEALVAAIEALDPRHCDCAVLVASEEPQIIRAVMTLVSDLPNSSRHHFIGIDNVAAGRTAASLLGRFLADGGKVAVIAGSLHLRDHSERLAGFQSVMAADFGQVTLLEPLEGHDERSETESLVADTLRKNPDLRGIYNLGAGNAGLVAALSASGRAGQLRVVVHELSAPTRAGLLSGAIDVVLDQNPDGEIREALAAARALALGAGRKVATDPIEIGIFLRDNLR